MPAYPEENVAVSSRRAFAGWVREEPQGRVFGQVVVRALPRGGFEVRHVDDRESEDLKAFSDPGDAREIARLTASGEHRPLKSAPNLRRGWVLRLRDERQLVRAMNYLYPAGVAHWYLLREGRLKTTSFRRSAARQSGIYERVRHLSDEAVQNAARACCGDEVCLKRTLWDVDDGVPLEMDRGGGEIPCPEPCSVFISFARRIRYFEREEETTEGTLTPSEKEDLATLVEAGAEGRLALAREAEFEKPLNRRRLRYRALTLLPKLRGER